MVEMVLVPSERLLVADLGMVHGHGLGNKLVVREVQTQLLSLVEKPSRSRPEILENWTLALKDCRTLDEKHREKQGFISGKTPAICMFISADFRHNAEIDRTSPQTPIKRVKWR